MLEIGVGIILMREPGVDDRRLSKGDHGENQSWLRVDLRLVLRRRQ
jgi:hypothetical protein